MLFKRSKYSVVFKAIAMGVVCLLLCNSTAYETYSAPQITPTTSSHNLGIAIGDILGDWDAERIRIYTRALLEKLIPDGQTLADIDLRAEIKKAQLEESQDLFPESTYGPFAPCALGTSLIGDTWHMRWWVTGEGEPRSYIATFPQNGALEVHVHPEAQTSAKGNLVRKVTVKDIIDKANELVDSLVQLSLLTTEAFSEALTDLGEEGEEEYIRRLHELSDVSDKLADQNPKIMLDFISMIHNSSDPDILGVLVLALNEVKKMKRDDKEPMTTRMNIETGSKRRYGLAFDIGVVNSMIVQIEAGMTFVMRRHYPPIDYEKLLKQEPAPGPTQVAAKAREIIEENPSLDQAERIYTLSHELMTLVCDAAMPLTPGSTYTVIPELEEVKRMLTDTEENPMKTMCLGILEVRSYFLLFGGIDTQTPKDVQFETKQNPAETVTKDDKQGAGAAEVSDIEGRIAEGKRIWDAIKQGNFDSIECRQASMAEMPLCFKLGEKLYYDGVTIIIPATDKQYIKHIARRIQAGIDFQKRRSGVPRPQSPTRNVWFFEENFYFFVGNHLGEEISPGQNPREVRFVLLSPDDASKAREYLSIREDRFLAERERSHVNPAVAAQLRNHELKYVSTSLPSAYWDKYWESFYKDRGPDARAFDNQAIPYVVEKILEIIKMRSSKRETVFKVLQTGSADGKILRLLRDAIDKNFPDLNYHLYGVDINAERLSGLVHEPHLTIVKGSATDLSCLSDANQDNSFDIIIDYGLTTRGVLDNQDDVNKIIAEWKRLLRQGGDVLSVPYSKSTLSFKDMSSYGFVTCAKTIPENFLMKTNPVDFFHFRLTSEATVEQEVAEVLPVAERAHAEPATFPQTGALEIKVDPETPDTPPVTPQPAAGVVEERSDVRTLAREQVMAGAMDKIGTVPNEFPVSRACLSAETAKDQLIKMLTTYRENETLSKNGEQVLDYLEKGEISEKRLGFDIEMLYGLTHVEAIEYLVTKQDRKAMPNIFKSPDEYCEKHRQFFVRGSDLGEKNIVSLIIGCLNGCPFCSIGGRRQIQSLPYPVALQFLLQRRLVASPDHPATTLMLAYYGRNEDSLQYIDTICGANISDILRSNYRFSPTDHSLLYTAGYSPLDPEARYVRDAVLTLRHNPSYNDIHPLKVTFHMYRPEIIDAILRKDMPGLKDAVRAYIKMYNEILDCGFDVSVTKRTSYQNLRRAEREELPELAKTIDKITELAAESLIHKGSYSDGIIWGATARGNPLPKWHEAEDDAGLQEFLDSINIEEVVGSPTAGVAEAAGAADVSDAAPPAPRNRNTRGKYNPEKDKSPEAMRDILCGSEYRNKPFKLSEYRNLWANRHGGEILPKSTAHDDLNGAKKKGWVRPTGRYSYYELTKEGKRAHEATAAGTADKMLPVAERAHVGLVKRLPEGKTRVVVDGGIFENDHEFKQDIVGRLLDGQYMPAGDMCHLEQYDSHDRGSIVQNILNIIEGAEHPERIIVQVPTELDKQDLDTLKAAAPGVMFMPFDTRSRNVRGKRGIGPDFWKIRFSLYATLLAARNITPLDLQLKEGSPTYRTLRFLLKTHGAEDPDSYIRELSKGNLTFLLKNALSFIPIDRWSEITEYQLLGIRYVSGAA